MKLTKEELKEIIKEEMLSVLSEEEVGSFYKTESGAHFGREMGINGLMEELEEARGPILKIKALAEECADLAHGGDDSFALNPENFKYFTNMVKICDSLLEKMQHNVIMQFEGDE